MLVLHSAATRPFIFAVIVVGAQISPVTSLIVLLCRWIVKTYLLSIQGFSLKYWNFGQICLLCLVVLLWWLMLVITATNTKCIANHVVNIFQKTYALFLWLFLGWRWIIYLRLSPACKITWPTPSVSLNQLLRACGGVPVTNHAWRILDPHGLPFFLCGFSRLYSAARLASF